MKVMNIKRYSKLAVETNLLLLGICPKSKTQDSSPNNVSLSITLKNEERVLIFSGNLLNCIKMNIKLNSHEIVDIYNESEIELTLFVKEINIPRIIFKRKTTGYSKIEKEEINEDSKFTDFLSKLQFLREKMEQEGEKF